MIMKSNKFRQLPVVDEKYNLLGIISRHDILVTLKHHYEDQLKLPLEERNTLVYPTKVNTDIIIG